MSDLSSMLGPFPEEAERLGIKDDFDRLLRREISDYEYCGISLAARERKRQNAWWRRLLSVLTRSTK